MKKFRLEEAGTTTRLPRRVSRAIQLLSAHHSRPRYREVEMYHHWNGSAHQWGGAWSPQMPKGHAPKKKAKDEKGAKDKKDGVIKPYDSTSTVASSSQDGSTVEAAFMKEFLSFVKESGAEVQERFQKFMPNDKMMDIRNQQKKLNKQRNVAQKIESKRRALEKDGEQWTLWTAKMREEIQAEKDKHIANQERLQKELEVLLEEQKNLAKDEDTEMEAKSEQQETEESLDSLLREEVPAPSTGDFNKALGEMQAKLEIEYGKRLEEERQRMKAEMMSLLNAQNQQQQKKEDVVEVSDNEGTEEIKEVKGVRGIGLLSSALPTTPFGMQRLRRNNGSSPYGTGKKGEKESPNEKKEEEKTMTMEDVLKARMEEKPPDTGQS